MELGQIITLLSGAGIGAILSAILVFINNSKKNKLDFVTKERSEWRREIKSIIVDLLSENNRYSAINRLETQLNPYGRNIKENNYEFYMSDGHIWKLVDKFDYSTKNVKKITRYLELLLKYDWERSKREIYNNYEDAFFMLINFLLFLFTIYSFLSFSYSDYGLAITSNDTFEKFLKNLLGIIIVFIFPLNLFLILFQKRFLKLLNIKRIKYDKNLSCKKCLIYLLLFTPYIFCTIHVFILGNKLIDMLTIFGITENYITNRLLLLLIIPTIIWLFGYIRNYRRIENFYIEKIKKLEKDIK